LPQWTYQLFSLNQQSRQEYPKIAGFRS
jgi:hypothetical protein